MDPEFYIHTVLYKLHPTFNPPQVLKRKKPFSLRRLGWGTFEIDITITWKSWLKKEPTEFKHLLSFEGDGKKTVFSITFDKDLLESKF